MIMITLGGMFGFKICGSDIDNGADEDYERGSKNLPMRERETERRGGGILGFSHRLGMITTHACMHQNTIY